jgi:hypothetical protein
VQRYKAATKGVAMSIHAELAQAETAAVETALAALRARPPERCARCGGRTFDPKPPRDGYWRCLTCFGGTLAPAVPDAEKQAVILRARREARAAVLEPGDAVLRRQIAVHEQRDRRALGALLPAMRAYLLHRANPSRYPATPAMREWRDDRLLDLAQKFLELTGHEDPFALRAQELVKVVLFRGSDVWTRAQGYQATVDFPGFLDAVSARLFFDAYADTTRSFAAWTTAITVADFKSTIASVVDFPDLLAIPEHGEYASGDPFGAAVPVRLTKFGRVMPYTREAVLRDDVPALGQLQAALGVAAAHAENDVVYDLLTSNPTLPDGFALFSAQHGNLMPAKALDATSLAAACAALAPNSQHGRPAFLVVGTKDGPTARNLVWQQTPPNAGDAAGVLQVVQDDRIASGFYVTCDPHERATFVTAHLAGIDGPELLSQDSWTIDARSYKGRNEFGAAVVSASSMVYTPSA